MCGTRWVFINKNDKIHPIDAQLSALQNFGFVRDTGRAIKV